MEETLIIKKDNLKEFKTIELCCENLEVFVIPVKYILDIYLKCDKKINGRYKRQFFSSEGYIKLSKDVMEIKSSEYVSYILNELQFTDSDFQLYERLKNYMDICHITLYNHNSIRTGIAISYDPIESVFGGLIESSNCHSIDLDEEGNVIIKYGNLSSNPKRKNECFEDIVENWNECYPRIKSNYLDIELYRFFYKEKDGKTNIKINFESLDDRMDTYLFSIVFEGVKNYQENELGDVLNLTLYKLHNGHYLAQLGDMYEFEFERCYLEKINIV